MKIIKFQLENFKSFENVIVHFDKELNILTGVNNSGKTTILEALALWSECFRKLINQARKAKIGSFKAGDFILGPTSNRYFDFDEINSVRSPFFEDLFRNRDKKNKIKLCAILENEFNQTIEICFKISDSVGKYIIDFENHRGFDYDNFNRFFKNLPNPIGTYYASPVAFIEQKEEFSTDPQVSEAINLRKSSSMIRNRLYRLYQTQNFTKFQNDLSYILFNKTTLLFNLPNDFKGIKFYNKSDIQKDSRVLINYTIDSKNYEKDLALLGSGTLQAIEILLNLYQHSDDRQDINLILLDEPDSHIHRDIQKRLLEILLRFSSNNQLFITTHNESLIRNTPLKNLFHIENNSTGEIHNMYSKDLNKIGIPHFKGMYPNPLSPLIKSLGNDSGLDFVNAIEAERIIFVEGDDDARIIYRLLQEYPKNSSRKFMFWVLGGVSKVFDKINSYKTFFSDIKNEKTLWEKSFLIFDKDAMIDNHVSKISEKLKEKLSIENHVFASYTQESVLFSDLEKLSRLLEKMFSNFPGISIEKEAILANLETAYSEIGKLLEERYSESSIEGLYKAYQGQYVEKTKSMFGLKTSLLEGDDVKLVRELKDYYHLVIKKKEYFKLMTKEDVSIVINKALSSYGLVFNVDDDFYTLICCVDKSTWYAEWDFLKRI